MINPSDRPLLRHISQGLALGALMAGMAMMAFAAGLALLGAMFVIPITVGFTRTQQFARSGPKAPHRETSRQRGRTILIAQEARPATVIHAGSADLFRTPCLRSKLHPPPLGKLRTMMR
jgi:hypothetical protein